MGMAPGCARGQGCPRRPGTLGTAAGPRLQLQSEVPKFFLGAGRTKTAVTEWGRPGSAGLWDGFSAHKGKKINNEAPLGSAQNHNSRALL